MALRKISIHSKSWLFLFLWPLVLLRANCTAQAGGSSEPLPQPTFVGDYVVVDTAQVTCYDANGLAAACPSAGDSFYGQDAQYTGHAPSYTDNGDGTVTDNNTGLMWQQAVSEKMNYAEAVAAADPFTLAGYTDWRLPTIKELYSLMQFNGTDPSGYSGSDTSGLTPFINTTYFDFEYGDVTAGERLIDAQYWSSTEYVSTTMGGAATTFGVNFADGRIKGYPNVPMGPPGNTFLMTAFVRFVRGNTAYGINNLVDNSNGTITDQATGLMWSQMDSGVGMDWGEALAWVQQMNQQNHLGYNDWRLPDAKELQSIIDYSRSPSSTQSAAIDPLFTVTTIINEGGNTDYPSYWSGTTHVNWTSAPGLWGVYVAFGEALGWIEFPPSSGNYELQDVHGAGAQRSDPKSGDPADWPLGNGPQGDVVRIDNFVRLVRTVADTPNWTNHFFLPVLMK
ncbi:MAG: DUF1566 domain-containing protein [Chloroflexi bacterium]|nr:DUF1566 domain-containing protein [Chloroflexota bacterium]MBP8056608.1 DUF1566 domain-containing protein [Chloroflexota bacterium]